MIELELLGAHADGSQLVFTDASGERYLITIDDALKAAIRREEMQIEVAAKRSDLNPRDIQQLLRAGMEPAEIASAYGLDLARINRFVAPIMSERSFMVAKALEMPVGADLDAPKLQDVVIDRLATRAVDSASLVWNATRKPHQSWNLHLSFIQAARTLHASWEIEANGRLIRALDEQARWLTETLTPAAAPQVVAMPASASFTAPGEPENIADVEKLLDELASARGKRSAAPAKETPEYVAPAPAVLQISEGGKSMSTPVAEPEPVATPAQVEAEDTETKKLQVAPVIEDSVELHSDDDVQSLPGLDSLPSQPEVEKPKKAQSAKRRSVPTWDEIIFGAKAD